MRRIATHLAAGAAATTAAVALLTAPATAATPANGDRTLRSARPLVTIEALKHHKWKTGGSSGVVGAAAQGTWARYTKKGKHKVTLYLELRDTTPKDKLKPALGIKLPGEKEFFLFLLPGDNVGEGSLTFTATSMKVREAVGTPMSSTYFRPARLGKKYKKLF